MGVPTLVPLAFATVVGCAPVGAKRTRATTASSTRFILGDATTCRGATGGKTFPSHLKAHTTDCPMRRGQRPKGSTQDAEQVGTSNLRQARHKSVDGCVERLASIEVSRPVLR